MYAYIWRQHESGIECANEAARLKAFVGCDVSSLLLRPVAELQLSQDQGPWAFGSAAGLALFLPPQRHHDLQGVSHA